MKKSIVDVIMYLFECSLFIYYSNSLFFRKKDMKTTGITSVLGYILLFSVYQFDITFLNAVLIIIINFLLFKMLFYVSYKTAIFHSLIILVVMFASEIPAMSLSNVIFGDFNAFEDSISAYVFIVAISKIIYLSVMVIILKLFAQKESDTDRNKTFWLLFIIPFSSILMLTAFRYITYQVTLSSYMSILWIVSSSLLLFSNILVFFIYESSIKNTKELVELKAQKRQEEQDKKYYEALEQSNNNLRIFSHNIKNHLTQIRNSDSIEDIRTYIDELFPDLEKFSKTGISKNKMLDLIISKYSSLCEKHNIIFEVDVKTANLSYINNSDLTSCLNNLLDNAVDAASKSKERFIELKIFSRNRQYDGLIVKNSCDTKPVHKGNILLTSKPIPSEHGLGIRSIKKIIKKYNAIYDWEYIESEKTFLTTIAFKKNIDT